MPSVEDEGALFELDLFREELRFVFLAIGSLEVQQVRLDGKLDAGGASKVGGFEPAAGASAIPLAKIIIVGSFDGEIQASCKQATRGLLEIHQSTRLPGPVLLSCESGSCENREQENENCCDYPIAHRLPPEASSPAI